MLDGLPAGVKLLLASVSVRVALGSGAQHRHFLLDARIERLLQRAHALAGFIGARAEQQSAVVHSLARGPRRCVRGCARVERVVTGRFVVGARS